MLKLKDVTIKYDRQLILHSCNCEIASQSIIVAKNDINTNIIARVLAGYYPLDEGEIHLTNNFLSEKEKSSHKAFFVITENYDKLWKNYRLQEIPKIIKSNYAASSLCKKYNISPQASIDSLTKFQRLIYLISMGKSFNRTIFIFDQPTKHFDYEDLELFYGFLNDDFLDAHYVILTNRFDDLFTRLPKTIYQINSTELVVFKGGEKNVNEQRK